MATTDPIRVVVETGTKRVFASAVDWPGWARSARREDESLASLLAYGPRYARVVPAALSFEPPSGVGQLRVIERLAGDGSTDFGVPGAVAAVEDRPLDGDELDRQSSLLDAAWQALDDAVAAARGRELRKGPRGGGRELDKIVDHVLDAERAYLAKLGSRSPEDADPAALRAAIRATFRARVLGNPIPNPRNTRTLWLPRYFTRRTAWHALDHAWEIEDRAIPTD